jgi:hypothetical protein
MWFVGSSRVFLNQFLKIPKIIEKIKKESKGKVPKGFLKSFQKLIDIHNSIGTLLTSMIFGFAKFDVAPKELSIRQERGKEIGEVLSKMETALEAESEKVTGQKLS